MGEFNVDKTDGSLVQTAGIPDTYPASQVMLNDGSTSVQDAMSYTLIRNFSQSTTEQLKGYHEYIVVFGVGDNTVGTINIPIESPDQNIVFKFQTSGGSILEFDYNSKTYAWIVPSGGGVSIYGKYPAS